MNNSGKYLTWAGLSVVGAFALGYIALNRGEQINALWIVVASVCIYLIAYRFYGRYIAKNVLGVDATRMTPAVRHNDGLDYVPTDKKVLFGHHFAAIAGAGPLVGPVLAAQMGYLPGMIWILAGVVLAGAVQDFMVLFVSTRRDGRSLGELVKEEMGATAGVIALVATFMIMVIILAVLALIVVKALAESPWGMFTVAATIPIALLMGVYSRYIRPGRIGEMSLIGFVLLMASIIYGGDIAKWQKFTNTLRLRLLMRVSGRNNAFTPTVGEQINQIISNPGKYPVFESNDDNATVKFSGSAEYYKTYFNSSSFPDDKSLSSDHHIAAQLLDLLYDASDGFVDPRLRIWIKPRYVQYPSATEPDVIREMIGAVSGCTINYNGITSISEREPYLHYETLVGDTRPNHMLDYDELLFIKAEAAMNGWISGSAKEYYEAAITASCQKWGEYGIYASYPELNASNKIELKTVAITQKNIAALLASDHVKWNNTQQRLAEQKWLSLFWVIGFQMYHEMRRTGYPECKTGMGTIELNATGGKFIARYPYPSIAIANNRANYTAAFEAQGGTINDNTMVFPIWWSGQAVAKDAGQPWEHSFRKNVIAEENL